MADLPGEIACESKRLTIPPKKTANHRSGKSQTARFAETFFPQRQFRHMPEAKLLYAKAGLLASGSAILPRLPVARAQQWLFFKRAEKLPGYSGGSATVSHRLPY